MCTSEKYRNKLSLISKLTRTFLYVISKDLFNIYRIDYNLEHITFLKKAINIFINIYKDKYQRSRQKEREVTFSGINMKQIL